MTRLLSLVAVFAMAALITACADPAPTPDGTDVPVETYGPPAPSATASASSTQEVASPEPSFNKGDSDLPLDEYEATLMALIADSDCAGINGLGSPAETTDPDVGYLQVYATYTNALIQCIDGAVDESAIAPDPSEVVAVDPEVAFSVFKGVLNETMVPFFKDELPTALEADFYWVSSVDKVGYNEEENRLRVDVSTPYGSVYADDLSEWQNDTWTLFQSYSVNLWASAVEGMMDGGEGSLNADTDWDLYTPGLRLVADAGDLVVDCPGSLIYAVSQREASQADFEQDCSFKN